jgi:hypothetical protein
VGAGGRRGGLRGIGGGVTPHLQFQVHMLTICFKRVQNPHFLGIFRGGGGGVCTRILLGAGSVYCSPRNRSSVSSSLFENYSARSMPSLCEI